MQPVYPSPMKPTGQGLHIIEPSVLIHVTCLSHIPLLVTHSLISKQYVFINFALLFIIMILYILLLVLPMHVRPLTVYPGGHLEQLYDPIVLTQWWLSAVELQILAFSAHSSLST